jgi:thioredoxin reductase
MVSDPRQFPPGDYPAIIIGSGPGGLQLSYGLRRRGVAHAVLSADPAAGGMFRRWPFFQRLLSWTKPYAPEERTSRAYQRFDWNSLIADEPELRSLQAEFLDGTSYFPSRTEMEANLTAFAERAHIDVRYGCTWQRTRREDGPDGTTFVLETTDGEYRTRILVVAVGVAEPWMPSPAGIEHARHYADTREVSFYAGKRLLIIGKQNSGFELASGLSAWASQIILSSPSPAKLSVVANQLVGVRARYVQPIEDNFLGLGVSILDASTDRITRVGDALRVDLKRTVNGAPLSVEVDEVIAATGFTCPLQDLPALGVTTFGRSLLPAVTPMWQSVSVPGIYFGGTISSAAAGLRKHGVASHSGAVQGHRYNGLILADHIAATHFGVGIARPRLREGDVLGYLLREATSGPELWHQKGYLARVVSVSGDDGIRDEGILPLVYALDELDRDLVAMTVEADGNGAIYPVIYVRHAGRMEEHVLPGHPLLDFETAEHREAAASAMAVLLRSPAHA